MKQRTIKIRGKRIDNGKWVYGYLVYDERKKELGRYGIKIGDRTYYVESESVGRYTGLKDKNGVEIYEGNIVSNGNKNKKYEDIFEIYFDRGEFLAGCKRGIIGGKTLGFWSDNLEVIGNIYEHASLLDNR